MTALLYHSFHTLTRSLPHREHPTLLFILLLALCISCEQDLPCFDELRQYHAESLMLPTVSSDSITRFSDKVDAFVARHPAAEADPLYPQIQANIRQVRLTVTIDVSPAWDDDIRINF